MKLHANVKDFGAKGDSTTNDTAAFQAAIDTRKHVYVPYTGGNYIISNQLTIPTTGLHMFGDTTASPGSGNVILLNNFPAATDAFKSSDTGFPMFHLENLYFSHDAGTRPRDFWRMTTSETQGILWNNVVFVDATSGYVVNVPAGMQLVSARFRNVHTIGSQAGGMFISTATATQFDSCRWAANGTGSGTVADIEIGTGGTGAGITFIAPTFDGTGPSASNYTRLKCFGSVTVINPYFEWTSGTASGTLKNIWMTDGSLTLLNGLGGVVPSGGGFTLLPVDIGAGSATIIDSNLAVWGDGVRALKARNINNLFAVNIGASASQIDIDDNSSWNCYIMTNGQVMYQSRLTGFSISGTAPTFQGTLAYVNNVGATNMGNLTPVQNGKRITLHFLNGNTTLVHGAGGVGDFNLVGGSNYTVPSERALEFIGLSSQWKEIGRP